MIVLDASAVLAVVLAERGGDVVERALAGDDAVMSSANWSEVVGRLVDRGYDHRPVRSRLGALTRVVDVTEADAEFAGVLRERGWARPLSLGDRLCLALAVRVSDARVLTADRAWSECTLPVSIELLR